MSSAIQGPPNTYGAGLDFNYAVWTADSVLTFCNVPWNNDYRDIVRFANTAALDQYLDSLPSPNTTISGSSYARADQPVMVDIPFNEAVKYNYLRVVNPAQPSLATDSPRNFYYFITGVNYVAPDTTQIIVQLDVWQSYGYSIEFGRCYVDRGHIGIANSNAMNNFGRDYLAIPEGLDTGAEYRTTNVSYPEHDDWTSSDNAAVIIVSTVDLSSDPGTESAPLLKTATGNGAFGIPSGADIFALSLNNLGAFMTALSDKPWVSEGIVSLTIVPKFKTYYPNWTDTFDGTNLTTLAFAPSNNVVNGHDVTAWANWRNSETFLGNFPSRYQGLKKFLTAPYLMIEVTTFSGTSIFLRPENWQDEDAKLRELVNYFPPDQRVVIFPISYNTTITTEGEVNGAPSNGDDGGAYLDTATMIGDFPTLPVVNNEAIEYLAANKNGIAYQYSSANWSQQRALRSNQVSYDQASASINTSKQTQQNSNRLAQNQNTIANNAAWANNAVSAASGLSGTDPIGALVGVGLDAAATAMQNNFRNQSTHASIVGSTNANRLANNLSGYVRDTNKDLADWSAKGDYENAVAGINAQVNDSKLTEPSMSGQLGGNTFNYANGSMCVCVRWKMIDPVAMKVIGEYWLRYGYAVRTFVQMPSNFMVMSKFTYWKLLETYIVSGAMPETFKQSIRGIFEKGVTVWADPSYIGTTDVADNTPLEGISY